MTTSDAHIFLQFMKNHGNGGGYCDVNGGRGCHKAACSSKSEKMSVRSVFVLSSWDSLQYIFFQVASSCRNSVGFAAGAGVPHCPPSKSGRADSLSNSIMQGCITFKDLILFDVFII